ncbi:MAG: DUF134 domain-containing protein [candidate division FCPU426 bacterium]
MSRPRFCRRVAGTPIAPVFKSAGIPASQLEEVVLTLDEFEAIRLADGEALYQEQAAEKMNVSRQTFGRIIESAHKKIADCLVRGKALRIEGGVVAVAGKRTFVCGQCGHQWHEEFGTGRPQVCPACQSPSLRRMDGGCGGRGHGQGRWGRGWSGGENA